MLYFSLLWTCAQLRGFIALFPINHLETGLWTCSKVVEQYFCFCCTLKTFQFKITNRSWLSPHIALFFTAVEINLPDYNQKFVAHLFCFSVLFQVTILIFFCWYMVGTFIFLLSNSFLLCWGCWCCWLLCVFSSQYSCCFSCPACALSGC